MNLDQLLPYFDHYQRSGNGKYMASCPMPNHDDSSPSVSLSQDSASGNILMYCWGCGTKAPELVRALNLTLRDLFGDPGHPMSTTITNTQTQIEATKEDIEALKSYLSQTSELLELAEDYIHTRFGLSIEIGQFLNLGVDPGDDTINRPEGYEQFNSGVSHLIIPFIDPSGKPVGMQGRRLTEGEPRWRSKSGSGWSKIGCFGWGLDDPVIVCEGPSDALSVVGKANLPAIAVRGAGLASNNITEQIRDWLGDRKVLVIGDSDEAGERFAKEISEGLGIPQWTLPEGFSDISEFLESSGSLQTAASLATEISVKSIPQQSAKEVTDELKERLLTDLVAARHDEELKADLRSLPSWQLDGIFADIIAGALYGQRGAVRRDIHVIQQALRAIPPGGGNGAGNHVGGINPNPDGRPEILWNPEDQLNVTEHIVKDAMDIYSGEHFYQAAPGQYVKVIDEDLVNLKEAGVKSMLSQMGHWRVIQAQRELGHIPTEAYKMVTDPSWECKVPIIKRRVEVPFMLEDGNIVSTSGYHEESGVFLLPRMNDRIDVPMVPGIVTDEHVTEAKRIFADVVEGFVFKDDCSKANLIAMTLTSPLRELFRQNPMVPLLTSTAPQSGSGKGTSIRVPLSTVGIGPFSLSTTTYNSDENEFEKKLVGKLLKKSTYIFLDNIRSQVNSSVLEQMLTAAHYDGRTLGYSEVNSLSTMVLWVSTLQSTGSFNRDLTRRCVPVELIKNYKGKWAHKNIESYLADMRGQLIWACFVVARKWLQDGGVISDIRLDGYGGWTEVIGGILEGVLEYDGFLGNLESFRHQQDEIAMTVDGILERWLTLYGEKELPARFAVEDFDDPALHQLLGLGSNCSSRQVLNALSRQLDSQRGYIVSNSHMWIPSGLKESGHEGMKKHYRCVPLPEDD